ncbi:hypothetical protein GETHPA_03410 [Geothrix rubra]|uniref:Uncharacterized protein n=1 Tax=Geothrix rubra TaxID=2927977 RepID=A0ABQ5Q2I8_9BACT|nr:hypothetical protein [Geothrix rubra]GLH68808.1 hypothetical protein GETHPA_03410 [Geothrix rubra]
MATIQPTSNAAYIPPVKPAATAQKPAPRAEETREPAREAQREARNPAAEGSEVGGRLDVTA